jgi:DnaJ-domain-containing protein 1
MSDAALDAYAVLGVAPGASDVELRAAYRELVKRHHPDHNAGSPESAARFEQVQNAYAVITRLRQLPGHGVNESDHGTEDRIAAIEAELARQKAARQAAAARAEAARQTAAGATSAQPSQPTPEELGHYTTEDSFTKILDDAAEGIAERFKRWRRA